MKIHDRGFFAIFAALAIVFVVIGCSSPTATDPTYGISLSHTEHTFDSATVGYGTQDSLTVTVSNTGNQATGTLSVTTSSNSFTLSTSSLSSISVGGSATFTVRPNTGLDVGTYTATVIVSGGNGIMAQVNMSFTVITPVITSLDIHITAPTKGEIPASAITMTGMVPFSAGAVTWSPDDSLFQGEVVYTATVTLTANNGYTFTGLYDARINGQSAVIGYNIGTNIALSYTFPATLAKAVTGIAIKTQPNNLSYTHGDELDLTGLEVTLSYDDTTTENVASEYFIDKGITTIPAHGDTLSHSENNGKPVTVEQGHFTVNTGNLTVNPAPIYDISLSQTTPHTFPSVILGYGEQSPLNVTVSNTGDQATGELDVALSNGDTGSFTLSRTRLDSIISTGDTATFSIVPITGLDAGTYSVTVTVSGDNSIRASFEVSVTVNDFGDTRMVVIDMYDAAGDGWDHNGALRITVNGTAIPDARLGNGSFGTYTFSVMNGDTVALYWTGNSGSYHSENAFIVYYADTPPEPAFNPSAWYGNNALAYRVTGSLSSANLDQLLETFIVNWVNPGVSDPSTTPQSGSQQFVYYWVNKHGSLVTTNDGITSVTVGATLTITAQSTGYNVQQWRLNGVNTGQSGNTYDFSSTTTGQYEVGLFVEKDGKLYNTNIIITVESTSIIVPTTRTVIVDMYDAYGDGWNADGALRILVNGTARSNNATVSTTASQNTSGDRFFNTYTFTVNSGDVVQFYWTVGSGTAYQYENSFIVYYADVSPNPAFFTGSKTQNSYGPTSWNGTGSLLHRVRTGTTSGTVSGTLQGTANNTLLGSFTVQ